MTLEATKRKQQLVSSLEEKRVSLEKLISSLPLESIKDAIGNIIDSIKDKPEFQDFIRYYNEGGGLVPTASPSTKGLFLFSEQCKGDDRVGFLFIGFNDQSEWTVFNVEDSKDDFEVLVFNQKTIDLEAIQKLPENILQDLLNELESQLNNFITVRKQDIIHLQEALAA